MTTPALPITPKETLMGSDQDKSANNFLRTIIEDDLKKATYAQRRWGGSPGDAQHHANGISDPAQIRTRFPPEPNGYLHIGHVKSIWLNFELARQYGGICHLRYDDTNPEKEEQEYVNAIEAAVHWLGYDTHFSDDPKHPDIIKPHVYFASNYFDFMYRAAEYLIESGNAYVDEQSAEQMRISRGDFSKPGTNSPYRDRGVEENLQRFRAMREGKLADGAAVLRAKIDMASPNINLRDPAIYRIRRATHHNTGDQWCIYPMYTFAHPIEDALEQITHSLCSLEFEDQKPFYNWLLKKLCEGGLLASPPPQQYEFARLNVSHIITSKRKLRQLVEENLVDGWDDPRMPTIVGLQRRGYTPEALKLFCERSGVSKSGGWIDYSTLEGALRDVLDPIAPRALAVINPLKLELTNWDEILGANHLETCTAPTNPHTPHAQQRKFTLGREVWIERDDFMAIPTKGFRRLFPPHTGGDGQPKSGNKVRLKYGYVVECTGYEKTPDGQISKVLAQIIPNTKSGTAGADSVKAKGVIGWVGAHNAVKTEFRLYERLFQIAQPGTGLLADEINPNNLLLQQGYVEAGLTETLPATQHDQPTAVGPWQFERLGYFALDQKASQECGKPVFNRACTLKDGWKA